MQEFGLMFKIVEFSAERNVAGTFNHDPKFNGNRKFGRRPFFGRIYPPQGGGARALVRGRATAPNPGEPALN